MHLASGLFFERLPGGWVRMTKRETADRNSPFVFEIVTDANGWASIVTAMQTEAETVDGSTPEFRLLRADGSTVWPEAPPVGPEAPPFAGPTEAYNTLTPEDAARLER